MCVISLMLEVAKAGSRRFGVNSYREIATKHRTEGETAIGTLIRSL
jgi:hypothetical protein